MEWKVELVPATMEDIERTGANASVGESAALYVSWDRPSGRARRDLVAVSDEYGTATVRPDLRDHLVAVSRLDGRGEYEVPIQEAVENGVEYLTAVLGLISSNT